MTSRTPVPEHLRPQPEMATERQIAFIWDLISRKDVFSLPGVRQQASNLTEDELSLYIADLKLKATKVSKKKASEMITVLQALPNAAVTATHGNSRPRDLPDVPSGRYAIDIDDTVKFYRVDRPTEGKWAGYTFVKVQASDDLHPIRGEGAKRVLAAILKAGPRKAMERYGQELGHCGVCGRTLTDETSREIGIGPVCRGDM